MESIEINLRIGSTIDNAFEDMQKMSAEFGCLVFADFNGKRLTSDMSLDECYIAIRGITKDEHTALLKEEIKRIKAAEIAYKKTIPHMMKKYMDMGLGVVRSDKMHEFKVSVQADVGGTYKGYIINSVLEIIREMMYYKDDKDIALTAAKMKFNEQGHSGHTAMVTAHWVQEFSPIFGQEFLDWYNGV